LLFLSTWSAKHAANCSCRAQLEPDEQEVSIADERLAAHGLAAFQVVKTEGSPC
jgi:hypothetical protein